MVLLTAEHKTLLIFLFVSFYTNTLSFLVVLLRAIFAHGRNPLGFESHGAWVEVSLRLQT